MSAIHTPAFERWCQLANIDERTAQQILEYAQNQVQDAILDRVHPMLAAQSYLAAMLACFEGCNLPKKQRREFINDFMQILEPVVAERARSWAPDAEGTNVVIN